MFAWFHTPDGANDLQIWIWKLQRFVASIDGFEDMKVWLWKLENFLSSIKYNASK
jgi:hypothetical protein